MPPYWSSLLLALSFALPAVAQDCPEGDGVCDEELYALEEALFMYESGAASGLVPAAARCLEADSAAWRAAVERACFGVDCRMAALRDRLAVLDPLQPAATRLTDRAHPLVAGLVAVIAPEEDAAVAPAGAVPQPPATASGRLVHAGENIHHMGLALRSDMGEDVVVVFDMDIGNQPGHEVLAGLAVADTGRFTVRGVLSEAEDGRMDFDPGQCRLVYRAID